MGVMASRRRQVGHIRIEVELAKGTPMLGVKDMQVAGTILTQAANLVENALAPTAPRRGSTALRTGTRAKVPRAFFDQRLGKILDTRDSFSGIGKILPRSHALSSVTAFRHGNQSKTCKNNQPNCYFGATVSNILVFFIFTL